VRLQVEGTEPVSLGYVVGLPVRQEQWNRLDPVDVHPVGVPLNLFGRLSFDRVALADHEVPFSWLTIAAKLDHHPVAVACRLDRYFRCSGGNAAADALEGARILGAGWSTLVDEACRSRLARPDRQRITGRRRRAVLLEVKPDLFDSFDDRLYQLELSDSADERIDAFIWSNKSVFSVSRVRNAAVTVDLRPREG
jgi:hypothetical protein